MKRISLTYPLLLTAVLLLSGCMRVQMLTAQSSSEPVEKVEYFFGRMFPELPPHDVSDAVLLALGAPSDDSDRPAYMEDSQFRGPFNNSVTPVGMTYVGQLFVHDMSKDEISFIGADNDPVTMPNRATPWLDLDTIYQFDGALASRNPDDPAKLLMGNDLGNDRDYPRNAQGRAIIVDQRNDQHNNIAQLVAAFMHFHNVLVDDLRAEGVAEDVLFDEAKRLTIAHWQSIVLNDFMPAFVDQSIIDDVMTNGRQFYSDEMAVAGTMPVEFSVSVNRFGHSIARGRYTLNADFDRMRMFPLSEEEMGRNLMGTVPIPAERNIEWVRFFDFSIFGVEDIGNEYDQFSGLQVGRKIDRFMARPMLRLPMGGPGMPSFVLDEVNKVAGMPVVSLASLNLLRGKAFDMPSGQAVAEAMGLESLSNVDFEMDNPEEIVLPEAMDETPLFLYALEEARVQMDGEKLGDVGGRIVAEVVIGLLEGDPNSILNNNFVSPINDKSEFTMAELIFHNGWFEVPEDVE